jgi:hypothetical protein
LAQSQWIGVDEALTRTNGLLGRYPDNSALITDHIQAGRVPARGVEDNQLRPVDPGTVKEIDFEARRIYLRRDSSHNWRYRILTEAALDWSALEPLVQPESRTASRRTTIHAQTECEDWLAGLPASPVRRKEDVRAEAMRQPFGESLSSLAFDRAWANAAHPAWKRSGPKVRRARK